MRSTMSAGCFLAFVGLFGGTKLATPIVDDDRHNGLEAATLPGMLTSEVFRFNAFVVLLDVELERCRVRSTGPSFDAFMLAFDASRWSVLVIGPTFVALVLGFELERCRALVVGPLFGAFMSIITLELLRFNVLFPDRVAVVVLVSEAACCSVRPALSRPFWLTLELLRFSVLFPAQLDESANMRALVAASAAATAASADNDKVAVVEQLPGNPASEMVGVNFLLSRLIGCCGGCSISDKAGCCLPTLLSADEATPDTAVSSFLDSACQAAAAAAAAVLSAPGAAVGDGVRETPRCKPFNGERWGVQAAAAASAAATTGACNAKCAAGAASAAAALGGA